MKSSTLLDKDGNGYCCWLNGHGHFEERTQALRETFWDPEWIPGWIKRQGKFQMTGDEWKMDVGISHHGEEWCMNDDLKDFLLENHTFLHELAHGEQSYLHIGINDSSVQGSCELDGATLALLSSLRIGLSICWGYGGGERGGSETAPPC